MSDSSPNLELPDLVVVEKLAVAVGQKPFRIVADLMELRQLKSFHDQVDFDSAAKVANKYGFIAKRAAALPTPIVE